jgi:sugar-specific transcriptional regulator TrmB
LNKNSKIDKDSFNKDDIIKAFQNLGFSVNDARVYISLLSFGSSNPVKISEDTHVDRSRVYDSLRRLGKKGYIIEEPIKRGPKYKAKDPSHIISALRKEYNHKLELTEDLEKNLQDYSPIHKEPFLMMIKGEVAILKEIKELIDNAENFLKFIITPDLSKNREKFTKIVGLLAQKVENNPSIKIEIALNFKEEDFQYMLKKLYENKIDVYLWGIGDVLPYGLYLSEKSYIFTILNIGQVPTYDIGLTIENAQPKMMEGFKHLFEFNIISDSHRGTIIRAKKSSFDPDTK